MDKRQVMYDIERCISHVPDACRDCSHYTGTVGFGCMENLMADTITLLKEQEAKTGHWIINEYEYCTCSECGESYFNGCDTSSQAKEYLDNGLSYNYCPYCGAKMEKATDD